MKARVASVLLVGFSLISVPIPVFAHHSFVVEFDSKKPITIKGKFTKMDWVNPHSWIHVDVTGTDGKVVTWRCEAPPPNGLYRGGWRRDTLKPGDEIVLSGILAKDGTPTMWTRTMTTAGGRRTLVVNADSIQTSAAPPLQLSR